MVVVEQSFLQTEHSAIDVFYGDGRSGKQRERQQDPWISTSDVVRIPGNAFHDRLNTILDGHRFDRQVEYLCRKFLQEEAVRSPQHGFGGIRPTAADRLVRGTGFRARDRLADCGFFVATEVPGICVGRRNAGSLDDLPEAPVVLAVLKGLHDEAIRSYIPEPERGRRNWQGEGKGIEQKRVSANRRRIRGARCKRLQKLRSELTERSFAHMYETGGMRRVHPRGRDNILKRLLVQGAAFNLSVVVRKALGVGKPPQLQGLCWQLLASFWRLPGC